PTGSNLNYSNPEFDKLIDLAQGIQDSVHRLTIYQVAEEMLVDEAPWVFFYHGTQTWVHQDWIKGLQIPLIYNADKMTEIWIKN
ncbi:MAG: hypothetical protein GY865_15695, partial [candidate division Zixibacteria bacterium]|nr:hypothetical protein [candidate division Zixibacteria bacterium]